MKTPILITGLLLAYFGAVPAPPPKMTPAAAVKVLQASNDLTELVSAVKVAASDPSSRQALMAFLDGPSRQDEIGKQFVRTHYSAPIGILADPEQLRQWSDAHPAEVKKYDEEWGRLLDGSHQAIAEFFVQSNDPAMFEVFKHFAETKLLGAWWSSTTAAIRFARALPTGSALTPMFLDYADQNAQNEAKAGDPDDLEEKWLNAILLTKTDEAYARILQGISQGKYSKIGIVLFASEYLRLIRYEPRALSIYEVALERLPIDGNDRLRFSLFNQVDMGDPMVIDSAHPAPPTMQYLDKADPSVYPRLLKIILDAEKIKLTAQTVGVLAQAKSFILDLYAKHGLTPPTDAELQALPPVVIPPLPPASDKPVNAPSQPLPPANPSSATSMITPILIGAGAQRGQVAHFPLEAAPRGGAF